MDEAVEIGEAVVGVGSRTNGRRVRADMMGC